MAKSGNAGCSIDSKPPKAKPPNSRQTLELEGFKAWSLVGVIGFGVSLLGAHCSEEMCEVAERPQAQRRRSVAR